MEFYISLAVLTSLIAIWVYYHQRKQNQINKSLDASLEDESIYVEGVGNIKFEELDEMVSGDPNEGVKQVKDTMFREDLMQFEGEFLIPELPLKEERRQSIDDAFLYLQELFGREMIIEKNVLTPHETIFPVIIEELSEVTPLAHTIARMMDIDPESLEISFFESTETFDPETNSSFEEKKSCRVIPWQERIR